MDRVKYCIPILFLLGLAASQQLQDGDFQKRDLRNIYSDSYVAQSAWCLIQGDLLLLLSCSNSEFSFEADATSFIEATPQEIPPPIGYEVQLTYQISLNSLVDVKTKGGANVYLWNSDITYIRAEFFDNDMNQTTIKNYQNNGSETGFQVKQLFSDQRIIILRIQNLSSGGEFLQVYSMISSYTSSPISQIFGTNN